MHNYTMQAKVEVQRIIDQSLDKTGGSIKSRQVIALIAVVRKQQEQILELQHKISEMERTINAVRIH